MSDNGLDVGEVSAVLAIKDGFSSVLAAAKGALGNVRDAVRDAASSFRSELGDKSAESVESLNAKILSARATVQQLKLDLNANRSMPTLFAATQAELDEASRALKDLEGQLKATRGAGDETGSGLKAALENPLEAGKDLAKTIGSDLLGALGPTGVVVGAVAAGLAVLGGVMVEIAAHARETAAKIHDMYEVTGESVPSISAMKFAVEAAGGSLDQLKNVSFQLEQRMENSGKKVAEGLGAIGISFDEFRKMNPDQRMLAISEGFRNAGDDVNKAAAAMDIFGKQGRDMLPILTKPLQELTDQARELGLTMSQKDAEAAEEFELKLNTVKATASALWTQIGLNISAMDMLTYAWERGKLAVANIVATVIDAAKGFGWFGAAIDQVRGKLDDLPVSTKEIDERTKSLQKTMLDRTAFKAITLDTQEVKDATKRLDAEVRQSIETHKKAEAAAKSHADAVKAATDALYGNSKGNENAYEAMRKVIAAGTDDVDVKRRIVDQIDKIKAAHGAIPADLKTWHDANVDLSTTYTTLKGKVLDINAAIAASPPIKLAVGSLKPFIDDAKQVAERVDVINDKGVGMSGTVSTIGANLKDVGAIAQPSLKSLMDGLTTSQKVAVTFSNTLKQVPDLLISAFTGGGNFEGAIKGLATSLSKNLFSDGGPLASVSKSVGTMATNLTSSLGSTISGVIGKTAAAALPMVGALVGPAISLIGKLFSNAEKQINPLRQSFIDAAGGLGVLNARAHDAGVTLDAVLNAKNPEQYKKAIDDLNGALKFQDAAMQTLKDTAAKYKFSIEELGPAMQKQNLSEQAQSIYKDWEVLRTGGVDITAVGREMASSINDFVSQSKAAGQDVPANMRPILQAMIEQGKLVDANGNAYTSLEDAGITFSDVMTQAMHDVANEVKKLTDAITRGLTPSLLGIPTQVTTRVVTKYENEFVDSQRPVTDDLYAPTYGPEVFVPTPRKAIIGTDGGEVVLHKSTYDQMQSGGGGNSKELRDEISGLRRDFRNSIPQLIANAMAVALVKQGAV